MAHITISDVSPRQYFTVGGSPSTGPFNFTFPYFTADDVEVYVNGSLVDAADYTLTGTAGTDSGYVGGSITLDSAAAAAASVLVKRAVAYERTTDFATSGPFNITSLNTQLDKIITMVQQAVNIGSRSLRQAESDSTSPTLTIPATVALRASKALIFDASGDLTVSTDDYEDQATDAAASAAAAASSASDANASALAAASSETNAAASELAASNSESAAASSAQAAAASAASGLFASLANKSADYTLVADTDNSTLFIVDTSGGNVALTLPSIATAGEGERYGVLRTSSSNTLTLVRNGSDTINGVAGTYTVNANAGEILVLLADDATPDNWIVINWTQAVADETTLTKSGSTISIKALGVDSAQLAAGAVTGAKLNDSFVNDLTTVTAAPGDYLAIADVSDSNKKKKALVSDLTKECFVIACSDETTALTAGTAKVTFRMPYAFTVTAVRASLTTAQTSGSIFTVDINETGTTILSTKLTIDNTEKISTTAATAAVISDSALADDAEITVDIDQIGDGTAKGLKVYLIGYKA